MYQMTVTMYYILICQCINPKVLIHLLLNTEVIEFWWSWGHIINSGRGTNATDKIPLWWIKLAQKYVIPLLYGVGIFGDPLQI